MIKIDKALCTACSACTNICPKNCITMNRDKEAFEYPEIDINMCIDCHLCEAVCPLNKSIKNKNVPDVIACYNKDDSIRIRSSSGGIFYLLATYILEHNGIVFGATFDDDFHVYHTEINSTADLPKLMKSKYIQSSMGDSFKKAKKYLDEGKLVYFSGTPCQIKGLNHFLRKEYPNLITQDIVCHGVPSNKAFDKYVEEINNDNHLLDVDFRSKETSWKRYNLILKFRNNIYKKSKVEDAYINAFATLNANLRYSCYDCQANGIARDADITLGDFWGIEKIDKEMFDDKGTSLVLIHSQKGQDLFEKIKEFIEYKVEPLEETLKYNQSITSSPDFPKYRNSFYDQLDDNSFSSVVSKLQFYNKIKNKFNKLIRKLKK